MSEPNQVVPDVSSPSTTGRRSVRTLTPTALQPPKLTNHQSFQSSGILPAFDTLHQHKRGSDVSRRMSMSDQQTKGGIFHQLFHNNFGRNAK
ncbi:hypothetical protein L249_3418 [Ophiocordyceps polyrhachis-furcata BCC 54312]|uniref:Uncharacterized protein n=1 Tax=Ophiocordyceps polyrhachis-furcata BCC 54312 TaxID=1330021 RepID=A0A367LMG0_9HYPO|nr:hypothetical protein L249_3418 [Ophiocordyceps polyrhachis-furcata BCC 54312]